jgi:hypothetical protein
MAARSRDEVIDVAGMLTGVETARALGGFTAGRTTGGGRSHGVRARAPIPTTITKVPKIRH